MIAYLFLFSSQAGTYKMQHPLIQAMLQEVQAHGYAQDFQAWLGLEESEKNAYFSQQASPVFYVITQSREDAARFTRLFRHEIEKREDKPKNSHKNFSKETEAKSEVASVSSSSISSFPSQELPPCQAVVYACGGDGTMHEVAHELVYSSIALGILPTGTANDFSKFVYKYEKNHFSFSACLKPNIFPMDTIRTQWEHCINVISLGYDVAVTRIANALKERLPRYGRFCYYLAVLLSLFKKKYFSFSFDLTLASGESLHFEQDCSMVALCNGRYYGHGFTPAPFADIRDGVLDLCMVKTLALWEFISLIKKYFQGRHIQHPKVSTYRVVRGSIRYLSLAIPRGRKRKKKWGDFFSSKESLNFAEAEGIVFPCETLEFEVQANSLYLAYPSTTPKAKLHHLFRKKKEKILQKTHGNNIKD